MLRLVYVVELTWLLVDMFSGYLQNNGISLYGNLTVSALVRIGVVFLFMVILQRQSPLKQLPILFLLLMCFVWISVHALTYIRGGQGNIIADVQFHLKLMLPLLLCGVLRVQMEHGALDCIKVRRIVLINAGVLIFNLLLGLLGIGFGNYGESDSGELIGSKGFFYAGNEVSATLVAIFALVMFVYRDRFLQNSLMMLTVVGVFFITSIISLSKSSLIGFSLVLLFVMYSHLSLSRKLRFGGLILVSMFVTTSYWLPLLQVSIDRWEYFWVLQPDFFDFITSGRTQRIDQYAAWLADTETPWSWFFGDGQVLVDKGINFENDLLDITSASGFLGLLLYGVWASWAVSGLSNWTSNSRPEGAFTLYMVGIFLVISIVAGHVIYSSTLAPFIALLALSSSRYFPKNVVATHSGTFHRL